MKERKVTAERLLTLADMISDIATEAGQQVNEHALLDPLTDALRCVLTAAKSAAFNEARIAHMAAVPQGGDSDGT